MTTMTTTTPTLANIFRPKIIKCVLAVVAVCYYYAASPTHVYVHNRGWETVAGTTTVG